MARSSAKPSTPAEKQETAKVPTTPVPLAHRPPLGLTDEQIARRAYEIHLARGGRQGNPEQDWFQAERELRLSRQ
jgi:hypothetical protein